MTDAIPAALVRRYVNLMHQLTKLADGGTVSLVPKTSGGKQESRPPSGTVFGDAGRRYKPEHDPLALCLEQRWNAADDDRERRRLCAEYETRLKRWRRTIPGKVNSGHYADKPVEYVREEERARDERILTEYEGFDPGEVAAIESESYGYCSEASVRRLRGLNRRDHETGYLRRGQPDDQSRAEALRDEGMSIREIGIELSRPKSTIQGWLEPKKDAA